MAQKKEYSCARCSRPAPSGSCKYLRGVPLGPLCHKILSRREYVRANGPNPHSIKNPETGLVHTVSDHGQMCPDDQLHCLECPHLPDEHCPLDKAYAHLYPSQYAGRKTARR
jgi:hypothetical protein